MPQPQVVPVVDGNQVLSKWNQGVDLSLVAPVLLDLLTPAESLDHILIGGKDKLSLNGKALKWVWLLGAYRYSTKEQTQAGIVII